MKKPIGADNLTEWIFEYLGSLNMTPLYKEMQEPWRKVILNAVEAKITQVIEWQKLKTKREGN